MGHALARELNVTPWEALLGEVRRSAGEVAWLDWKVSTATTDDDLAPGGALFYWDQRRQLARTHMARVAKLALDAGVAERMLAQVQHEGEELLAVVRRILESSRLALNDDQLTIARDIMRSELLALTAGDQVIEGEVRESE